MEEKEESISKELSRNVKARLDSDINNDNSWGKLIDKANVKNVGLWKNFKIYSNRKFMANCNLCNADVNIGNTSSTGHLHEHMKTKHASLNRASLLSQSTTDVLKQADEIQSRSGGGIQSFFKSAPACPSFPSAVLDWAIGTYQPNNTVQHPLFRAMQTSLNPKVPFIGRLIIIFILY